MKINFEKTDIRLKLNAKGKNMANDRYATFVEKHLDNGWFRLSFREFIQLYGNYISCNMPLPFDEIEIIGEE